MTPVESLLVVAVLTGSLITARAMTTGARARRRLGTVPDPDGAHGSPFGFIDGRHPSAGSTVDPRHPSVQGDPSALRLVGGTATNGRTNPPTSTRSRWPSPPGPRSRAPRRRPAHRTAGPTGAGIGAIDGWGGFSAPTPPGQASDTGDGVALPFERRFLPVCAAALVVAAVVVGPAAAIALAAATPIGVVVARRRRREAWRRRRQAQLPVALERLASALRGGASVPGAMTVVGVGLPAPLGPELAALGREADAGRATADVLDTWATAHADAASRLAATALVLAATVGAAPARAADGVAATLRERADLAAERRALGAQARMSAAVLSIAPLGFAAFLGTTDAAATQFLLGTPAGWACLGVGLGLDVLGAWWMSRATRGDDR